MGLTATEAQAVPQTGTVVLDGGVPEIRIVAWHGRGSRYDLVQVGGVGIARVATRGERVPAVLAQLEFTKREWKLPPVGRLPQNVGQSEGQE